MRNGTCYYSNGENITENGKMIGNMDMAPIITQDGSIRITGIWKEGKNETS